MRHGPIHPLQNPTRQDSDSARERDASINDVLIDSAPIRTRAIPMGAVGTTNGMIPIEDMKKLLA